MTRDELKPCPFCGGENISHSSWDIQCYDCKATMPGEPDKAASRWNGRALTAALEVEQPVAVEIKPLEWEHTGISWQVDSPAGRYVIPKSESFRVFRDDFDVSKPYRGYKTADEAKAAAQQDYETRIRSAIVEVPVGGSAISTSGAYPSKELRE